MLLSAFSTRTSFDSSAGLSDGQTDYLTPRRACACGVIMDCLWLSLSSTST